jgi:hypothetical protein
MMVSMKVIRAVAPSCGPGGLYTAVASSSTEYGPLFAEYLDIAQHKEELGKHQLIMTASIKVIKAVVPSGGPTTVSAAASLETRPHQSSLQLPEEAAD